MIFKSVSDYENMALEASSLLSACGFGLVGLAEDQDFC